MILPGLGTAIAVACFRNPLFSLSILFPGATNPERTRMDLINRFRGLNKSCFIVGASGESGKALLKQLIKLKPFERIVLIGRRKLDYEDEELKQLEQRVINFDEIEKHKAEFAGFDVGYCCLGTTRGKSGAEGFVKIEHDYVVGSAINAKEGGTRHFHLISAAGVSENSWFLYGQTKGRTDREVSELGFERTSIYRPAMLMVDRTERRVAEAMIVNMLKPIACIAPTLITTPIEALAKAMVFKTVQDPAPSGAESVSNKEIQAAAKLIP
ncbi:putative Oxidoreductase HTATIP2 [Hypsibius exemplaris]|uniref:Oxidoreductase HTATIP2 n=1 Tax=Hypsibius exemplaris TaxID=2072580 RepID=A0A1W0WDT3_HYPEX|nr:putative Oxidoreductase HTATIP2 [Hypsibius exemplaris]